MRKIENINEIYNNIRGELEKRRNGEN